MADALEAGYDLGALALCFLAIGALLAVKGVVSAVASLFDFTLLGYRPLHGIAVALENGVIGALDDAIKSVEKATAKFESGLIDSFGMAIAIPALLYLGVRAALEYLWSSALKPLIHSIADPIRTIATGAASKVAALEATVARNLSTAEEYARGRASDAVTTAEAYVEKRISAAETTLRGDIAGALSTAESYASTAVDKLRAAEDAAVSGAVAVAADAKAAGLAAAAAAIAEAERAGGAALSAAEATIAGDLAQVDAAGKAALAGLEGVVINVGDDLSAIEGAIGAVGVGALIASIPAIATMVKAIATEAGLENAECRSKVKGICGTDPNAWAGLLEGLVAIGVGFTLAELVEIAQPILGELAPIVAQAA